MRILVTGAAGITGRAVIGALKKTGDNIQIRAFVHRQDQSEIVRSCGASETVAGDMLDTALVRAAMQGVDAVYHIGPTAHPQEFEIGKTVYSAAEEAGVSRFVYHSVLHSLFSDLPHHEKKHRLERLIAEGGIPYTILQPAALMQNLLNAKKMIREAGVFPQRFFAGRDVRMNLVDLEDAALSATIVLTEGGHEYATYELCGPQNLSERDITAEMSAVCGREIVSRFVSDREFSLQMKKAGMPAEKIETMQIMFRHYQEQGFMGNAAVLAGLLGRAPRTLAQFLAENL